MKKFRLLIVIVALIITLIISINSRDDKIYYVSLGDGLSKGINENNYESKGYSDYVKEYLEKINKLKGYTKEFSNENNRITDLTNNILNNVVDSENISIQNIISKADLITISIGFNELLYKDIDKTNNSYMYDYIDSYIEDINKLLELIRKYNNKKIYILGYYNPKYDKLLDKYVVYANNKLMNVCSKNKVEYIDTYNIFKDNKHLIYNINNLYPNEDGYKLIANKIINKFKNSVNNS